MLHYWIVIFSIATLYICNNVEHNWISDNEKVDNKEIYVAHSYKMRIKNNNNKGIRNIITHLHYILYSSSLIKAERINPQKHAEPNLDMEWAA